MKILGASINRRKKSIEVRTSRGEFPLPFSRLPLKPSARDPLKSIYVDSELGNEAVTYLLASGKEESIHLDAFLDYNKDPDFLRDMTLHKLTVEALRLMKDAGLSKNELIRRLRTSPSQLYRLLDPSNSRKSIDEMLRLLAVLGCRVDIKVVREAA